MLLHRLIQPLQRVLQLPLQPRHELAVRDLLEKHRAVRVLEHAAALEDELDRLVEVVEVDVRHVLGAVHEGGDFLLGFLEEFSGEPRGVLVHFVALVVSLVPLELRPALRLVRVVLLRFAAEVVAGASHAHPAEFVAAFRTRDVVAAAVFGDDEFAFWARLGVGAEPERCGAVTDGLVFPFSHDFAAHGKMRIFGAHDARHIRAPADDFLVYRGF
mmetsp:Transcript_25145/g.62901  ORF Transcript_25145/g.62901 Transcript_25145/m.62901 type:complete len:215 (+) Transcript_25145:361-1005(+)